MNSIHKIVFFATVFIIIDNSVFIVGARAQQVSLKDSTRASLHIDSVTWTDAWMELDGGAPDATPLKASDLIVRDREGNAEILSVDSIGAKFRTRLALSFVLDNSGSMFHAYDSLTKYCDWLVDSLPPGLITQAVTFDDKLRATSHLFTKRESVYIAQSGWKDSIRAIEQFWHRYDTIRTQFTPLYDAIAAAITSIEDRKTTNRTDVLIIVTDGEDNASRTQIESLRDLLTVVPTRLFAINFRMEPDERLEWLAKHSNGNFYVADDLKELRTLLHSMGLSISRQYHIHYRFPAPEPTPGRLR